MSNIEAALQKKFGKDIFMAGDELLSKNIEVIPVSPALDLILGGGIPKGSFVTMSAPPKTGKSSLSLAFGKNAQKQDMMVYYFDVEGRIKPRDLSGIQGLKTDSDHFEIIGSKAGRVLYAEDYIEILLALNAAKQNCLFIFDSFSQLCTKGREANDVGKRFRDDTPLLLADMTKRVSNVLPVNNNILIGTVHLISNQNPASRKMWTESAGQKVKYQADVRLTAPYFEQYLIGETPVGQLVHWTCECTALNAAPNQKTKSLFRYGYGIDAEFEILNICVDIGIVEKKASWIEFPNGEKKQGLEKARQHLVDDPKLYEDLKGQLNEMLGV